jgi:hypothetical protein
MVVLGGVLGPVYMGSEQELLEIVR